MTMQTAGRVFATLFIGFIGGLAFYMLSLPLPWMLGSMSATAVAAIIGIPVISAKKIRPPFATVIGVALGSAIHPLTYDQFLAWLPISVALVLSTPLIGAVGYFYFSRVARFDRTTAFFAGMPGGVYEMTHQGGLAGGDERRIALAQAVRIFIVVFAVPFIFDLFFHFGTTAGLSIGGEKALSAAGALQLAGIAIGGWLIATRLRLPNPPLLGPLIASAALHLAGWTDAAPPYWLLSAAQVVLGTSIGGQFIGADRKLFASAAWHGLALVPAMLLVAALAAAAAARFTDTQYAQIFLALAPGGTAELSLVALAIHADVAIVVTHQVIRIIMIYTCVMQVFRRLVQPSPDG
jgi:uncharacterized protein